jgi:hypothetical protein
LKNPFNSPPPSTSSNLKNIAQKNITYKQSEKIRKSTYGNKLTKTQRMSENNK